MMEQNDIQTVNNLDEIRVNSILKLFKGDVEIDGDRLEKAQQTFQRGSIKIRGFERILFGTGIHINIPKDKELIIRPKDNIALDKGLVLFNDIITSDGEITLLIYNATPFLTTIELNKIIAYGLFTSKNIDTI